MAHIEEQNCFRIYLYHFTFCLTKSHFPEIKTIPQCLPLLKLVEKKIVFWAILSSLQDRQFFDLKENFFGIIWRKCFKIPKKLSLAVCGIFCGAKQFSIILSYFTCKTTFWVILTLFLRWSLKRSFLLFSGENASKHQKSLV